MNRPGKRRHINNPSACGSACPSASWAWPSRTGRAEHAAWIGPAGIPAADGRHLQVLGVELVVARQRVRHQEPEDDDRRPLGYRLVRSTRRVRLARCVMAKPKKPKGMPIRKPKGY